MSKTRMGKRVASLLLSLVMMLSLLPTTVYAEGADTGDTTDEIVGQATTSGDNTEGTGEPEPTGEGEDGSANVTEGEDGAATNDAVVEETIAPVNAEGVDAVANAESSGDEVSGEEGNEATSFVTVNGGTTQYATLEEAIAAAEPVNGVITYTINGKVDVTATDWIQVAKAGLTGLTAVKFVGATDDAEICITGKLAILADQNYDIDVSFENLTLSKLNPTNANDYGHSTEYFTTWLRNANQAENTVTYTKCTFPNGVSNNQYGKTVFDNCQFTNATGGLYNLWNYGGNTEVKNSTFTGVRGIKAYSEGTDGGSIKVAGTKFDNLTQKAAIVASKPVNVEVSNVDVTGEKGFFTRDITGKDEVQLTVAGTGISGTFEITSATDAGAAKNEFNISAGTFTSEVPNDYCADGFEVKASTDASGNTTYGVEKAATAVAKIGDKEYATLADAIDAAKTGDTVTLLADTTEDVTIDKNITLDLGGKTLTNTNAGKATISVSNGATATVKNGSVVGGTSYYNIEVTKGSNANLTLEGVTATAGNTGSSMIDNWGTLTIESGDYSGGMNTVKSEEGSTLTINGGKFTLDYAPSSGYTATILVYGDTTITGGEFIQNATPKWGNPQVVMTGVVEGYTAITRITGGTFTNKKSGDNIFHGLGKATSDNFEVSGGTFNKSISDGYCADGFIPTKNADGTYGVKEGKYVARIGSTKYETLADAIRLAANGKTVKLLADVTENVTIAANKKLTLDLNGKTLNGGTGTAKAALRNLGTITITDSSERKTGTIKRDDNGTEGETSYYVIDNKGTMTIESGTVSNNSGYRKTNPSGSMIGSSLICNGDDDALTPVLNIKGGKFVQENFIAIKNGLLGTLNVSGGEISSEHSAIQNWYKATITGGTINGQLWTDAFVWKEGESVGKTTIGENAKFTGEIVMDIYGNSVAPKLEITGGDLDVTSWRITTAAAEAGAKPAVSGGTFTSAVPENCCADGYIPTKNEDGSYGVKGPYVAKIGSEDYATLQAAIDAATRNQTVTMLANTKENVTISTPYVTLDLNGHTLNGSTGERKPALTVTARVTVKDSSKAQTGTIMREDTAENSGVSSHYVIDIQDAGWLTFEGGNVKNGSGAGGTKGASLVRVGNDSVAKYPGLNIKGGTFTQDNFIVIKVDRGDLFLNGGTLNSANSYAIENWHRATVKGGTVNGTVAAWTYSGGLNSTLEISGGTVNGNIASVNYDKAADKQARVYITGGTVTGTLGTYTYNNGLVPTEETSMATIEVTGGTFSSDPTKYVVEDSAVTENEDNTFGVAKAYLAKVGETSYYTMDEAFKAQTASGEAIVLLRDYTTGSTFNSGTVARVVDLGGHTWTCTGTDANSAAFEINNPNAKLTVKNGKIVSSQLVGLIPSAMGGTIKYDNSSLTFENVEMSTTATSGIETNGNNANDTVTLKNSTLDVPNGFGIYFPSSGTLTIDNSTITAKTMGVQVCAGSLSINAGSAITVTGDAVPKTENDGAIQDGAAISIVNRNGYKGLGNVTVTGGTFTAKTDNAAIKAYDWANNTATEFTANDKVFVSGGSFNSAVPEGLCKDGYISVANGDGTYTVKKGTYVAEYNGTKYTSLQEAIDAASHRNGGQTEVKLLCNLTITETVNFAKQYGGSVLLNLGGYTLTGEGCRALQINKGNLYLENGTVTSTDIINSSSVIRIGSNEATYNGATPMLYMQKDAKVVAPHSYGVTIFGSATRGEKLKVMSNAEIIATGPSPAISGNGGANYNTDDRTSGWKAEEIIIGENAVISAANNYAIYHPECGKLDIQGGTITGTGGIQMCSGTLKISNSPKITANGSADYDYTGDAGVVYDAAAISVINRGYPQGPATATIKGTPTVTAANGEVIHAFTWSNSNKTDGEWAEAGDYINVSGGTYSKTFNPAYLAADCTLVAGENGTYTVEQKPVAEYNGNKYTSLSQAIRDANNAGGTVKLLDNVTLTKSLGIGGTAKVTLNLNKKILTLDGAQIYTQGSAAVTINSGTIKRIDTPTSGSANNFAIQVMSGSTLLLGGSMVTNKLTLTGKYGIYNVGGLLNVQYADITTDGWSIAVRDSASRTGSVIIGSVGTAKIVSQNGNCIGTAVNSKPNVTISKGTLTSNGTTWDAGVVYWASEGTLTITGGTFTASSAEGSEAAAVYQKNGTVKISGTTAKLLGSNALVVQAGEGSTGTMVTELSGGTYSTRPDEAWVVEGKEIHETTDGLYKVEGPYVVEVTHADGTTTSYDAWSKLASVWNETGATIKLLKDTTTSEIVATNGDITIDFNGKTLTVTKETSSSNYAAAIVVHSGGKLTLKDSSEAANGGMTATNVYGVEVITGSSVTVKSGSYNCDTSVVQVDNGTAYIEGGTFQTEAADKSYLLNCIDKNYGAGTAHITVTGGTFYGFDPANNKAEGEGTSFVPAGYVSTKGADGYTVEQYKPVEVWTGFAGKKVASYATIEDAVANLGDNKWIVIAKNYTLDKNFTIGGEGFDNLYLDVAKGATLTVAEGVTLTVAANAKRLGVREDATVVNNGTILVRGSSHSNGFAMLYGTFTGNALTVPEGYFLDNNGENFFATANEKAVYEITFGDGTVKKTADSTNIKGGNVKQIKLLQNVTKGGWTLDSRSVGPEVVLDLNGHELSYDGANRYYATLNVYTKVTIKNGTVKYEGSERGAIDLVGQGDLTIESDVIIDGGNAFAIFTSGTSKLTVNGTVKANGNYAIAGNGSKDAGGYIDSCDITVNEGAVISAPKGVAIYHPEKGTVTINGGEISGHTGVQMCSGELIINGGSITVTGDAVPKTGNDGGILDGAAISLINRNYPGGVPTAEITGGTFKATGTGAQTVKAYDYTNNEVAEWKDAGSKVNISGGTFSSIPSNMAALCKVGYRAVEDKDNNVYIVKEANIAIQVTSRIKDDGVTTVSTTTGGGMYCEGEEVTVTTSNVVGFKFLGWYEKDSYMTPPLSADLSYTFTASKNCTLVALYSPAENATLTVKVTASAFRITGSRLEQNNGGMYKLPVGSSVTVTYTDDTYTFLYWVNGSDKIVSTSPEYTFTLGSNTELRACTSPKNTENDNAMVVFKTAYDQVLTAKRYGNDEEIVFPMGPSKTGHKFIGWSMTQAKIRAAMAENDYIVVTPEYETLGSKYTVTVKYEGIDKADDTHTINVGDSILLTAVETVGEKTFSYWMIDDQIVSYLTTLTVFESKNVIVTAVYGVEANAEAKIRISDVSATQDGLYYLVTFTQAFALPEDATLVLTGFIRADDEESAANMNINRYSRIYKSSLTRNDGVYYQTIASKNADKTYYMMAFVQYKDAKGNLQTVYSECVKASYASLKGGN